MESHAVRSIQFLRTTLHHDDVLVIVDLECCDRACSVVDNGDVLLIREEFSRIPFDWSILKQAMESSPEVAQNMYWPS